MKRHLWMSGLIVLLITGLVACSGSKDKDKGEDSEESSSKAEASSCEDTVLAANGITDLAGFLCAHSACPQESPAVSAQHESTEFGPLAGAIASCRHGN